MKKIALLMGVVAVIALSSVSTGCATCDSEQKAAEYAAALISLNTSLGTQDCAQITSSFSAYNNAYNNLCAPEKDDAAASHASLVATYDAAIQDLGC